MFQHFGDGTKPVAAVRFIITERQRLFDVDDRVNAEPAQSLLQPPVDIFIDFPANPGIFPVQIRLLSVKNMQIKFIRAGKRIPHGAAETGTPVAGASVFFVRQIEKIAVGSVRILFRRLKPGMFVGAVIDHQIHQQIHSPFFCLCDQFIHILHRPKAGIDGVIV